MAKVERFMTPVFRLSFPELWEARSVDGGEPKFGLSAVWTPSEFTEVEKALWKKIKAAMDKESMARFKMTVDELPANFKKGIRDGRERQDMEGYGAGTVFASVTSKLKPGVVLSEKGEDGKFLPCGPQHGNAEEIYPGIFARATVTVYSYENKGKGVALGLMNLQKVRDGDRLDSRTDAAEDFADDLGDGDAGAETEDFLD